MKILVSGAGIAGLTLAYCLRRVGHEVLIVEKAPHLRDDGYLIDFFGHGYVVASRLGMLSELETIHYPVERLGFRNAAGDERFSIPYATLRKTLFGGRHFNLMRGDLVRLLHTKVERDVDMRFATTVTDVAQDADSVRVTLSQGAPETVDLLVGADGLHSQVRSCVFGPEKAFSRFLGYHAAAYIIESPALVERIGSSFDTLTVPGRQVAVYPIRGGKLATFFIHKVATEPRSAEPARDELRRVYRGMGWIVPELLERLDEVPSVYLDPVSQIVMPRWNSGRVVLIGDASHCASLLAGQGASLAMTGAYVFALELAKAQVREAAEHYERRMRPGVERRQRSGQGLARWFVPDQAWALAVRDLVMRLSFWGPAAWLVRRQFTADDDFP